MKSFATVLVAALAILLTSIAANGSQRPHGITDRFDHDISGFVLEGGHEAVPCEGCHRNRVFAGTPRSCANCHNSILAEGKGPRHIPTALGCETCHSVEEWRLSRFDHTDILAGCVRCHNNFTAPGKTANHPATSNVCEDCHSSVHWNLLIPGIAPQASRLSAPGRPSGVRVR